MRQQASIAQFRQSIPKHGGNNHINNNNNNNTNTYSKQKIDRIFSLSLKRTIINQATIFVIDTINITTLFVLVILFHHTSQQQPSINYYDDETIQKLLFFLPLCILFALVCSTMFFFRIVRNEKLLIKEVCFRLGHCTNQRIVVNDDGNNEGRVLEQQNGYVISEVYYCYKEGYVVRCQQHPDPCICSYKLHWLSLLISNQLSFLNPSLYFIQLISNLSLLSFATYLMYLLFNKYFTNFIIWIDVFLFSIIVWIGHGMFLLFFGWNVMRAIYRLVKAICPCFFTPKLRVIQNQRPGPVINQSHKPPKIQRKQLPPLIIKKKVVVQQVANCSICLDPLKNGTNVAILQCSDKHRFHQNCIKSWKNVNPTCPSCRSNIVIKKVTKL